jgi:hypothetical protein
MVSTLRLADIIRNPDLQTRPVDPGTARRYAQAYKVEADLPPITVVQIEGGPPMLLDGWHRVTALESLQRATVEAEVITARNLQEARWLAMKANLSHGLPLKRSQRREVFGAFMRADQWRKGKRAKSLREIAKELGTSHNTVSDWMQKDFARISREWFTGQRDERGDWRNGGLREPRLQTMCDLALRNLDAAAKAFDGINSPEERGEVVGRLEDLLRRVKAAGNWKPWKPEDF